MSKVNRPSRKSKEEYGSSKKRNNNGKEKNSGMKASTTSGSMTDSSGLRRSLRNSEKGESHRTPTPTKKKPEKLEEPPGKGESHRTPTPTKKKPEKGEEPPSPPRTRKSERVEKQVTQSTPRKQKLEIGMKQGTPISDSKKKSEKGEKQAALDTRELENTAKCERKDVTPTSNPSPGVTRPKRLLNARNYRAILGYKSKMTNAKEPGPCGKPRKQDSVSRRDSDDDGDEKGLENEIANHGEVGKASLGGENTSGGDGDTGSDSKGIGEGRDGPGGSKRDKKLKPRGKKLGDERGAKPGERYGSSSTKNAKGIKRKLEKTEFTHSRKKLKFHSQEAHGPNHSHNSPESDPGDTDSLCGSQNAGLINPTGVKVKCSKKKNFQILETTDSSSSEGRSQTVDTNLDICENIRSADECGTSERKRNDTDPAIDVSVTAGKEVFSLGTSSFDASSSPSEVDRLEVHRRESYYRCAACFKKKRVDSDSQNQEICSCSAKPSNDMCGISFSKGARKQAALSRSPQRDEIVVNAKENLDQDATAQLAEPQRLDIPGIAVFYATTDGTILSELDRVGLKVNASIAITEERGSSTQLKESTVASIINRDLNACVICKLGGKLLCCDGKDCARTYHLSCLDPPLNDVPPGIWHCLRCVKKKLELGVHSVSEGVEAIWDLRESEISAGKGNILQGIQKEKQYFVKFRGLAHVHNHWIPERRLLVEAPMLVTKFNRRYQKEKVTKWKSEWTIPHRLLQKRLLMSVKQADEYFRGHTNGPHCKYEWFVKWKDLGYEHCTWELENEPFISSVLIKDYESRREKAKKASDPSRANKVLQERRGPFSNLRRLPDGIPPGLDGNHLRSVNKLRESWHKYRNAVVIDDQERITRVILFILSLQSAISRPFLIISTSTAVSVWESEFMRLAPSVHLVVYSGSRDTRETIRSMEFFEEGGCVMFDILLSTPDAIVEDFDTLECIGWEAIIVDECQRLRMSKHFQQFQMLSSDFRLLLLSDQIKDNEAEYLNLLTFLDKEGDGKVDVLKNDHNGNVDALATLKERLRHHLAYEGKSESSRFIEYWVPIQLSKVQLEQYCTILASNYGSLRSNSAKDEVGALRDVLISARKCCDHPYLVDESLQSLLTKGLPLAQLLNVGVNASGKLQLLDKILQAIRVRGLRVLIIFQLIGGSKPSSIGDILDDYLRQRFGDDSYERVDSGLIASRKQAALNKFNNKERGRFVFLIENRACLPSIKLSSVDIVILFDSDWNPLNDLRALQKITIDSQFEHLPIFRLYSPYTVEEKVLILAKQGSILESSLQNMSSCISHMLLMGGSTYLFNKLDELRDHDGGSSLNSDICGENPLLNDLVIELLNQLPHETGISNTNNFATVIRAQQSGATYCKTISLVGESEIRLTDDELPHVFWTKLLEGRFPGWKYSAGLFQRPRRKVQHVEEPLNDGPSAAENDGGGAKKKRKQVFCNSDDPISHTPWLQDKKNKAVRDKEAKLTNADELQCNSDGSALISGKKYSVHLGKTTKDGGGAFGGQIDSKSACLPGSPTPTNDPNRGSGVQPMVNTNPDAAGIYMVQSEGRRSLRDAQHNLHLMLKPELSTLCETLQLPELVKAMALKFLEYIMNNHQVSRESETILQAFQISLCWMAASFLKQKIDHKLSLSLAKQCLNFQCKEEAVESVYSKLRLLRPYLKKEFLCQTGPPSNSSKSSSHEERPRNEEVASHVVLSKPLESTASDQQELEEGEIAVNSQDLDSEGPVYLVQEPESQPLLRKGPQNNKPVNRFTVEKIGSSRIKRIIEQQKEFGEFNKLREKEKSDLKKAHRLEREVISSMFGDLLVRKQKLKELDEKYDRKRIELERCLDNHQKKLAAVQLDARNKEKLNEVNSGRLTKSFAEFPLPESGLRLECLENREQNVFSNEIDTIISRPLFECRTDAIVLEDLESSESGEVSAGVPAVVQNQSKPNTPVEIVNEIETDENMSFRTETNNTAEVNMPLRTVTEDTQENMPTETVKESTAEENMPMRTETVKTAIDNTLMRTVAENMAEENMPMRTETENTAEDSMLMRTVTENIAEENMLVRTVTENTPVEDLLVRTGLENTALERTTVSEAEQHSNEENSMDDISEQQNRIGLSSQLHRDLDQDDSLPSYQVASVECYQLAASAGMEREHVPGNEGWSCPQQIEGPIQQMVDPILSQVEHFSHSVSLSQPFLQLPLPPHMDVPVEITPVADPRSTSSQPESSNHAAHNSLLAPQMPQHDPLNNELIRMRKDEDQAIKMHEEEKMRLKTECEKEIEEIQRKYNTLLQDVESAFLHRRKLLDMNFNKVFRNKLLADAFKLQLYDSKTGPLAAHSGTLSLFVRMLQQPLPPPGQGPAPPPISVPRPPLGPPRGTHGIQHSASLFPSNLMSPRFSPVHPRHGNLQAGEPRAPGQLGAQASPSRPSAASMLLPTPQTMPSGFPGPSFLPHRATFPIPPPVGSSLPNFPVAASSTRIPTTSLGLSPVPMFPSSNSASALELLMDLDNRPLFNMPVLPESDSPINVLQVDSSRVATETVTSAAPVDIVCLSDDD